jgi:hypothetical protein
VKVQGCSKATLDAKARQILMTYNRNLLDMPQSIPVMEIMENMFNLEFEYQRIRKFDYVLGLTVFNTAPVAIYDEEYKQYEVIMVNKDTVVLDERLLGEKSNGRLRFTCAHELGHYVRHKDYYLAQDLEAAKSEQIKLTSEEDTSAEWQVDYFAGCLLMPKSVFQNRK